MRSSLTMLIGLAIGTNLSAQEAAKPATRIGIQLRTDATATSTKTDGQSAKDSFGLQLKTARFLAAGEASPTVTYTLRLDLKNAFYADKNQDGGIAALDRAYFEIKPMDGVSIRLGRLPFAIGSMEADYSSIDQYLASYLYEKIYPALAPINVTAEASYSIMSQTVAVQLTNGLQESKEFTGSQQMNNLNYSLSYRGKFANGMVKPIISYNSISRIRNSSGAEKDDKVTYTAYAVGSQFSVAGADLDLEYDKVQKPKFKALAMDADKKVVLNDVPENEMIAVVAQLAYNLTDFNLRPLIKFSEDLHDVAGKEIYKSKRSVVAVEYMPGPKGFRYHFAYTMKDEDVAAGADNVNTKTSQFLVGTTGKL